LVLLAIVPASQAARYTTFALPGFSAGVFDINDTNTVVGTAFETPSPAGFTRAPNGRITRFRVAGAPTLASAINDAGEIAGTVFTTFGPQAYIRSSDGLSYEFFSIPGSSFLEITGINDAGQVSGYYNVFSPFPGPATTYGFVRNSDGSILTQQLPGLPTFFTGINDSGDVSGYYLATSLVPPVIPGDPPGFITQSYPFFKEAGGGYEPFTVAGAPGNANDLNNAGDIAGDSQGFLGAGAYVRFANGGFMFLSVPNSTSTSAFGINNLRNVAGTYLTSAGVLRGYIAFTEEARFGISGSAPEPGSALLVLAGIAIAAGRRLTRRSR
jgi:hypothetical protein